MITREEAKEFLPIIQAFAEGKTIQVQENEGYWRDADVLHFNYDTCRYRIKPEPKYRPFKDAEECWQEMQKHQPFGWVKDSQGYVVIQDIWNDSTDGTLHIVIADTDNDEPNILIKDYTFADGEPFGVKEV